MRRPTLLCLFHCAPPAEPQPASDTVLRSVPARHWETPEQGYPSDESVCGQCSTISPSHLAVSPTRLPFLADIRTTSRELVPTLTRLTSSIDSTNGKTFRCPKQCTTNCYGCTVRPWQP